MHCGVGTENAELLGVLGYPIIGFNSFQHISMETALEETALEPGSFPKLQLTLNEKQ